MIRLSLYSYIEDIEIIKNIFKEYLIEEYKEKRIIYKLPEIFNIKIKEENLFKKEFWENENSNLFKFLSIFNSKNSKLIIKERDSLKDEFIALELYNPDLSKDRKTNCVNIRYFKTNPINKYIGNETEGFFFKELSILKINPIKTLNLNILKFEINNVIIEISKLESSINYFIHIYLERIIEGKNQKEELKEAENDLEKVIEEIKFLNFLKLPSYLF